VDFDDEQLRRLEPLTQHFVLLARARPAEETSSGVAALQEAADSAESIFGSSDVLLTPMLASAPPPVGWFAAKEAQENYVEQCRFTPYSAVINVLGLPAVNVPVHTDQSGMSWSVQLVGRHGTEEQLLALAAAMAR